MKCVTHMLIIVRDEGAHQSMHPCGLIRAFVIRCLDGIINTWAGYPVHIDGGSLFRDSGIG